MRLTSSSVCAPSLGYEVYVVLMRGIAHQPGCWTNNCNARKMAYGLAMKYGLRISFFP